MTTARDNLDLGALPRAALQGITNYLPLEDVARLKNTSSALRNKVSQCQAPTRQSYSVIFEKINLLQAEKSVYKKELASWGPISLLIKFYRIDTTDDTISPISLRQFVDGALYICEFLSDPRLAQALSPVTLLIAAATRGTINSFENRTQALDRADERIPIINQAIDLIAEANHPKMRL